MTEQGHNNDGSAGEHQSREDVIRAEGLGRSSERRGGGERDFRAETMLQQGDSVRASGRCQSSGTLIELGDSGREGKR